MDFTHIFAPKGPQQIRFIPDDIVSKALHLTVLLGPSTAMTWVQPAIRLPSQDYTGERLVTPAAHGATKNDGPENLCRPAVPFFIHALDVVKVTTG
jgi:hypothetical protein